LRETKGSRFLRDKMIPYMKVMAFASLQVVGKDSSLERKTPDRER
jgi:hypothetical protein